MRFTKDPREVSVLICKTKNIKTKFKSTDQVFRLTYGLLHYLEGTPQNKIKKSKTKFFTSFLFFYVLFSFANRIFRL